MNNILRHPDQVYAYTRLYASSVAAIIAWGHRAKDFDSFFYKDFYAFVEEVSIYLRIVLPPSNVDLKYDQFLGQIEPGATPPVDQAPWLWYLPGAWKTHLYKVRQNMDKTWTEARRMVEGRRKRGDIRDSMIDIKLSEYEKNGFPYPDHGINNLFGEILEAGADSKFESKITLYSSD